MRKFLILITILTGFAFGQTINMGASPQLPKIPQDPNGVRGALMLQYDAISGNFQYYNPIKTTWYSNPLTSTTSYDSVNFGLTSQSFQILNDASSTDTLYICKVNTFTGTTLLKITGGEAITLPISLTHIFCKFGYTATASKKYRVIAW